MNSIPNVILLYKIINVLDNKSIAMLIQTAPIIRNKTMNQQGEALHVWTEQVPMRTYNQTKTSGIVKIAHIGPRINRGYILNSNVISRPIKPQECKHSAIQCEMFMRAVRVAGKVLDELYICSRQELDQIPNTIKKVTIHNYSGDVVERIGLKIGLLPHDLETLVLHKPPYSMDNSIIPPNLKLFVVVDPHWIFPRPIKNLSTTSVCKIVFTRKEPNIPTMTVPGHILLGMVYNSHTIVCYPRLSMEYAIINNDICRCTHGTKTYLYKYNSKQKSYFLHADGIPAITDSASSYEVWAQNGVKIRDPAQGPAVTTSDGKKYYAVNGKLIHVV